MNHLKSFFFIAFVSLVSIPSINAACTYEKVIHAEELAVGMMLNWTTEAEENNSMFIVEKSLDGIDFSDVGTVEGAGTSNEIKKYSFLDVMAKAERIYYRLKQVDFDGKYIYSDVLSVDKKGDNQFMVVRMSSVAAKEKFDVTLNSITDGTVAYTLLDAQGDVVEDGTTQMLTGLNYINIDMVDKATGIYKLKIQMGEEKEMLTFKKINDDMKNPNFASKNKKN